MNQQNMFFQSSQQNVNQVQSSFNPNFASVFGNSAGNNNTFQNTQTGYSYNFNQQQNFNTSNPFQQSYQRQVTNNGFNTNTNQSVGTNMFGYNTNTGNDWANFDTFNTTNQQNSFNQQTAFGQQNSFNQQNGFSQQNSFNQQSPFNQQTAFGQQNPFNQQNSFNQQNGFNQQNSFNQQTAFGQQSPFNQQNSFNQQTAFGQQSGFNQQNSSNQQSVFNQQSNFNQQSGFNNVFSNSANNTFVYSNQMQMSGNLYPNTNQGYITNQGYNMNQGYGANQGYNASQGTFQTTTQPPPPKQQEKDDIFDFDILSYSSVEAGNKALKSRIEAEFAVKSKEIEMEKQRRQNEMKARSSSQQVSEQYSSGGSSLDNIRSLFGSSTTSGGSEQQNSQVNDLNYGTTSVFSSQQSSTNSFGTSSSTVSQSTTFEGNSVQNGVQPAYNYNANSSFEFDFNSNAWPSFDNAPLTKSNSNPNFVQQTITPSIVTSSSQEQLKQTSGLSVTFDPAATASKKRVRFSIPVSSHRSPPMRKRADINTDSNHLTYGINAANRANIARNFPQKSMNYDPRLDPRNQGNNRFPMYQQNYRMRYPARGYQYMNAPNAGGVRSPFGNNNQTQGDEQIFNKGIKQATEAEIKENNAKKMREFITNQSSIEGPFTKSKSGSDEGSIKELQIIDSQEKQRNQGDVNTGRSQNQDKAGPAEGSQSGQGSLNKQVTNTPVSGPLNMNPLNNSGIFDGQTSNAHLEASATKDGAFNSGDSVQQSKSSAGALGNADSTLDSSSASKEASNLSLGQSDNNVATSSETTAKGDEKAVFRSDDSVSPREIGQNESPMQKQAELQDGFSPGGTHLGSTKNDVHSVSAYTVTPATDSLVNPADSVVANLRQNESMSQFNPFGDNQSANMSNSNNVHEMFGTNKGEHKDYQQQVGSSSNVPLHNMQHSNRDQLGGASGNNTVMTRSDFAPFADSNEVNAIFGASTINYGEATTVSTDNTFSNPFGDPQTLKFISQTSTNVQGLVNRDGSKPYVENNTKLTPNIVDKQVTSEEVIYQKPGPIESQSIHLEVCQDNQVHTDQVSQSLGCTNDKITLPDQVLKVPDMPSVQPFEGSEAEGVLSGYLKSQK